MKYIFISILIVSCVSCESNSKVFIENKPKQLLDERKFTEIYKEILFIESAARITEESGLKADSMILVYSDQLLASKKINREIYKQSYDYYAMNAEKFLEINESIKTELGVLVNKDRE